MQRKPSSQAILQPPDQSEGRILLGPVLRVVVRVAAAAGFLLYIISGQPDSYSGSALGHIPNWSRWGLVFWICYYGWWETSLYLKKPHQRARKKKPPNMVR